MRRESLRDGRGHALPPHVEALFCIVITICLLLDAAAASHIGLADAGP